MEAVNESVALKKSEKRDPITVNASVAAKTAGYPMQSTEPSEDGGAIRVLVSTYTVQAGGLDIGDRICWGSLGYNTRLMPTTKLYFSDGAKNSTLTLGDREVKDRYMKASSVSSAGNEIAQALYANGGLFQVNIGDSRYNRDDDGGTLYSTVGGASLKAGQVITLVGQYSGQR